MNPESIVDIVMELSILPFFPAEDAARIAIVRMVGAMAANEDQVRWLVNIMTSGAFSKWEGPAELRAVFCMKFKPKDGIEATSAVYPDGMTREQLNHGLQIAAGLPLQIAGEVGPVSLDPEMELTIVTLTEARRMPGAASNVDVKIRSGEDEYSALVRVCREEREKKTAKPYTPSEAQIEFIKSEQDRNRKESVSA